MAKREALLAAREPFYCEVDGEQVVIRAGQRVRASHPVVQGREALFEPVQEGAVAGEQTGP